MTTFDISHLHSLSAWDLHALRAVLSNPGLKIWGGLTEDRFSSWYDDLVPRLSKAPEITSLLERHILGQMLVYKTDSPPWMYKWIQSKIDTSVHLGTRRLEEFCAGTWAFVPVLLTGQGACIRYFTVGCLSGESMSAVAPYPEWASAVMDPAAMDAVISAAGAACSTSGKSSGRMLFCWPLLADTGSIQITGGSLGLALYIGFKGVLTGEAAVKNVVATGRIDDSGNLDTAGNLAEKFACAAETGFSGIICPSGTGPPAGVDHPIKTLAVSCPDEAWMIARLYATGEEKELLLFAAMQSDPGRLVDNLDRVPPEWITWAHRNGLLTKTVARVFSNTAHFANIAAVLKKAVDAFKLEQAEAICTLGDSGHMEALAGPGRLSRFRWAVAALALANHRGRITAAKKWVPVARDLLDHARTVDPYAAAEFYNNHFIARHNRYFFQPQLPEDLLKTLRILEDKSTLDRSAGCLVAPQLGAFYGTIAQNYAFCGPGYIEKTAEYADLAFQTFGQAQSSEYRRDALRQQSYLFYAYADAGRREKARGHLFRYLEIDSLERFFAAFEEKTDWHHTAMVRFLSEFGDRGLCKRYLDAASEYRPAITQKHPWQLWCWNVGRIAIELGRQDHAGAFFNESLAICRSRDNGMTVFAMSLLPLSGLQQTGQLEENLARLLPEVVQAACELNSEHFADLGGMGAGKILDKVWRQPGTFFPFTYR